MFVFCFMFRIPKTAVLLAKYGENKTKKKHDN